MCKKCVEAGVISYDNAVRIAEIERIEAGNPNYKRMVDTLSYEYKKILDMALAGVDAYAKEHGLSAKEKKELEQAQAINARRYYLQARNLENRKLRSLCYSVSKAKQFTEELKKFTSKKPRKCT